MKAIILAAGMSKRLKPFINSIPKCLLEFGGKTIIEYQIEILHSLDKGHCCCIGFSESKVMRKLNNRSINYVFNNEYKTTNSSYSLWLSKKNLLIMNLYI